MKKQVNILERDEKKQVNFSVHCESLVRIYAHLSHFRHWRILFLSVSLSTFLLPSLCILTVEIINLYSVSFCPSQQSALMSHMQTRRNKRKHKCTHKSCVWHKPDRIIKVNLCKCLCVSSPLIGGNKTLPHWVCPHHSEHNVVNAFSPADGNNYSHHRFFDFFTHGCGFILQC